MVNIAPPPTDWTHAIASVAEQFMDSRVCFFRAGTGGDFDIITGTGDEATVELIWVGMARVQHMRSPSNFSTDYQSGANRPFRFQIARSDSPPFLSSGVIARVLVAGMDHGDVDLEQLVYVTDSAINASHQAVRTVELRSTMRPVEWSWDVDESGAVV